MKSILIFFFILFTALGAGVYFYESQIASPNAADALVKNKKKVHKTKTAKSVVVEAEPRIKKPSLSVVEIEDTIAKPVKPSRVVDFTALNGTGKRATKEQISKQREIEKSIKNTIRKSISLEIQKAVVTEISKKR